MPPITSLCEACIALELVPLLLKEGKHAAEPENDTLQYKTVKEILNGPECDLCQYALSTLSSTAAKTKRFDGLPPPEAVEDALVILQVHRDLRNEVLPCRALSISLDRYMGESLHKEFLPACPDAGASQGTGSTIARIPSDVINPKIIRKWIQTCQEHHVTTCCVQTKREFDFDLWAIDVVDMKLAKLPDDAEYLALSYVWGQTPALVTTEENKEVRSTPGGLRDILERSPSTVRDAVKLTGGMKMRYLWIDQLCVIRGDDDLLSQTLRAMGSIYHHATATIVAADGSDANAGLSGVNPGTRNRWQHHAILGSGRDAIALIETPRTILLDGTTYLRRAWT